MCLTNYLNILVLELLQTHQNMSPAEVITFSQVPSGNMEILKEFAFTRITQTQLSNYSQKVLNNLNHLYYL